MGRVGVKNPKNTRTIGKTAVEIRTDTRNYIHNERDTILQKWRALEETCKSEDRQRLISNDEIHKAKVHYTPLSILKFIGTLRKAVKLKIMYQGGTTYSIIRELFIYWDKDKSNEISASELKMCMDSLGVKMTEKDREEIISYYDSGKGSMEMNYLKLMKDITRGEPSVVEFREKELPDCSTDFRFEEIEDSYQEKPPIVEQYVFALHQHVYKEISAPGALGTPVEHGKKVYSMYFGVGMTPMQLVNISRKNMGLIVSLEHAKQVVDFYDRKKTGKMDYTQLVQDACQSMMTMISYIEPTDTSRLKEKQLIKENPFIPRPFVAPQSKKLEQVKRHLKMALNAKISEIGGTTKSILVDHFKLYDQHNDGKIHSYLHLQAIAKNIGATLSRDDALSLMNCYDRDHTGSMVYTLFIKDLTFEDRHFLDNQTDVLNFSTTATSRTPSNVSRIVENFRTVVEAYARKSAGDLQPRDILHGTFLRFDPQHKGRMNLSDLNKVLKVLNIKASEDDVKSMLIWFDTNGSSQFDYNELSRQLYGDDVMTRPLSMPKLSRAATAIMTASGHLSPISSQSYSSLKESQSTFNGGLSQSFELSKARGNGSFSENGTGKMTLPGTNILCNNSAGWSTTTKDTLEGGLVRKEKNMAIWEGKQLKHARNLAKKNMILEERNIVQRKLESIEFQRRALIDDFKMRRTQTR